MVTGYVVQHNAAATGGPGRTRHPTDNDRMRQVLWLAAGSGAGKSRSLP